MKRSTLVTIASLLSILFLTLHICDDIVRGFDKAQPANLLVLLMLAFWLYGVLVLPQRRWWYAITLIGGILAAAMPAIHLRGTGTGNTVKTSGGYFFLWALFALGVLGGFCIIASVRGLVNPQWGQSK